MSWASLRVASLNVWALPLGLAPRREERLRAIAERMRQREVDVWGFQEVWTDDARAVLSAGAEAAGYGVVHGDGGLMIASRMPFRDASFRRYKLRGIATHVHRGDHAGGKGFQRLTLESGMGPVVLFNTHLHAQYTSDGEDPFRGHRMGQIVELAHALAPVEEPLVALGDFNIREGSRHYQVLMGLAGLEDAAVALDRREGTSSSGTRIDLILTRGPRPHSVEVFAESGVYSDHAAIRSELSIAPGGAVQPDPNAIALARTSLKRGRLHAHWRLRDERALAASSALVGAGSILAMRHTRRRFLLGSLAVAGFPLAAVYGLSAGRFVPEELAGYEAVLRLLSDMA